MTMQITFHRGNYTGHWVEDKGTARAEYIKEVTGFYPPNGSGSLEILFKSEREIVLHDKVGHTAEKVLTNYVEPNHHHLAEQIVDTFLQKDVPLSAGLKAVGKDDRHIEYDVNVVRGIMKTLMINEGYDPRDLSVFDFVNES